MHRRFAVLLALALASTAPLALAMHARADVKVRCVQEIDKLCPDSEPGSPERRACVRENMSKLPAECQEWLTQRKPAAPAPEHAGLQSLYGACGQDKPRINQLCPGEKGTGASLFQCMNAHRSELSEPCAKYLSGLPQTKPASGPAPAPAS
jgi:hypothetical protein